jgi:hypothetical protein
LLDLLSALNESRLIRGFLSKVITTSPLGPRRYVYPIQDVAAQDAISA